MTPPTPAPDQFGTLTATIDQLQAELDAQDRILQALAVSVLGLSVLLLVYVWDRS